MLMVSMGIYPALLIFKVALGSFKFALDGWGNSKWTRLVSAGIGAYLGFQVGGGLARTNPTFGKGSGAIIGAVSGFLQSGTSDKAELFRKQIAASWLTHIALNNLNEAKDAGVSDETIVCLGWFESSLGLNLPGNKNYGGMLFLGTQGAKDINLSAEEFSKLNDDFDFAIRASTRYLRKLVNDSSGNVSDGLFSYRHGATKLSKFKTGNDAYRKQYEWQWKYSNKITQCAQKLGEGKLAEGLAIVKPNP